MDRSILFFFYLVVTIIQCGATPLDDYVNRPDPTYRYDVIDEIRGPSYTLYTVNMTSQTWKPDLQSQPVWWHYLTITIPDKIDKDSAFMYLRGGSNEAGLPSLKDDFVAFTTMIATTANSVAVCLKQIPNQPIVFKDDPMQERRYEDGIIAWTWKSFIDNNGSDPEILLRMPMTKAVVRAIDTVQDVAMKLANVEVNRFMVSGASKRGWTTWMAAAVDDRVVAIAPIVMDLLNLVKNLHNHYRSLGGWTFEFIDYYQLNFTASIDTPAVQLVANIIDPLVYSDRYSDKQKFIVTSGGDEFFMLDDSRFYYNQLAGPTYLRMVPNTDHYSTPQITIHSIRAFYPSVMTGTALPKLTWKLQHTATGGSITLQTDRIPDSVNVFYATTLDGKRKDFRRYKGAPGDPLTPLFNPVFWSSKSATLWPFLLTEGNNTYYAECTNPMEGWTAFFIQATFPGVNGATLEFTTETLIIPDTYPFPDCQGAGCRGVLV